MIQGGSTLGMTDDFSVQYHTMLYYMLTCKPIQASWPNSLALLAAIFQGILSRTMILMYATHGMHNEYMQRENFFHADTRRAAQQFALHDNTPVFLARTPMQGCSQEC